MTPLKLAVIGTGALGRHHARILSTLEGVKLEAVADLNSVGGQDVAARCQTRWVADYHEILDQIDAAVIAVPTQAHWAVAKEFLARQIPVLIEKPLTADLEQARELVDMARAQNTLLQVGHVERFNPAFLEARPLIGRPKYIRSERFSPFSFRSTDIGVVHDVMIHDLDLVLSLARSEVIDVQAFGVQLMGNNEDCVQARLTFADGCIADLAANRVSPSQKRALQVWSTTGCTDVDFAAREVHHYSPSDLLRYGTLPVDKARQPGANLDNLKSEVFGTYLHVQTPSVPTSDALTAELTAFLCCLRTGSRPLVGGEEALAALTVADRILHAVSCHQWENRADGLTGPALLRQPKTLRKAG